MLLRVQDCFPTVYVLNVQGADIGSHDVVDVLNVQGADIGSYDVVDVLNVQGADIGSDDVVAKPELHLQVPDIDICLNTEWY